VFHVKPNRSLPPDTTYIDGQPYNITDREIVTYWTGVEVERNGKKFIEHQKFSFTIGTVRPA
jgi:hypothetical protein